MFYCFFPPPFLKENKIEIKRTKEWRRKRRKKKSFYLFLPLSLNSVPVDDSSVDAFAFPLIPPPSIAHPRMNRHSIPPAGPLESEGVSRVVCALLLGKPTGTNRRTRSRSDCWLENAVQTAHRLPLLCAHIFDLRREYNFQVLYTICAHSVWSLSFDNYPEADTFDSRHFFLS